MTYPKSQSISQRHEERPPAVQPAGRVEHLRAVSLFEDIKGFPGALERLAEMIKDRSYAPGSPIIREGECGHELFLLVDGEASVYKITAEGEEYKVAILRGSQHVFFGEGALLDSEARSATIKADSSCRCLVLDRAGFEAFSTSYPQWALPVLSRIARVVMARLRKTNDDLMLLYNALMSEIRGN